MRPVAGGQASVAACLWRPTGGCISAALRNATVDERAGATYAHAPQVPLAPAADGGGWKGQRDLRHRLPHVGAPIRHPTAMPALPPPKRSRSSIVAQRGLYGRKYVRSAQHSPDVTAIRDPPHGTNSVRRSRGTIRSNRHGLTRLRLRLLPRYVRCGGGGVHECAPTVEKQCPSIYN